MTIQSTLADLADEIAEADLADALGAVGADDGAQRGDAFLQVAIDLDVIIFRPMAHLVEGLVHALAHDFRTVLVARGQPPLELVDRGRQDEDADEVIADRLLELLRALPVEIADDLPPLAPH